MRFTFLFYGHVVYTFIHDHMVYTFILWSCGLHFILRSYGLHFYSMVMWFTLLIYDFVVYPFML